MIEYRFAIALHAGEQTARAAANRLHRLLDRHWPWVAPLASRYIEHFEGKLAPQVGDVMAFLFEDQDLQAARVRHGRKIRFRRSYVHEPLRMRPMPVSAHWDVPKITTVGGLADWLGLDPVDLEWFADLRGAERWANELLRHYQYTIVPKRSGGSRLIESPKTRMKQIQRQVLDRILYRYPAHPAAHGFVPGRSIVTFAAPHTGRAVVLRLDLLDFFPSIGRGRLNPVFRVAGYPSAVADRLAGLCTNATPRNYCVGKLHALPHLPQGAPTSPALANICAYRMDTRLTALARKAGLAYTRYADDLAFSGDHDFHRGARDFAALVSAIAAAEGFTVNQRKTRVMAQGARQHPAGLVVNQHPNVPRREFDALKAVLTNCVRHGAASQNHPGHPDFRAHLEGRVAFVEMVNPQKGYRLRRVFDEIEWP